MAAEDCGGLAVFIDKFAWRRRQDAHADRQDSGMEAFGAWCRSVCTGRRFFAALAPDHAGLSIDALRRAAFAPAAPQDSVWIFRGVRGGGMEGGVQRIACARAESMGAARTGFATVLARPFAKAGLRFREILAQSGRNGFAGACMRFAEEAAARASDPSSVHAMPEAALDACFWEPDAVVRMGLGGHGAGRAERTLGGWLLSLRGRPSGQPEFAVRMLDRHGAVCGIAPLHPAALHPQDILSEAVRMAQSMPGTAGVDMLAGESFPAAPAVERPARLFRNGSPSAPAAADLLRRLVLDSLLQCASPPGMNRAAPFCAQAAASISKTGRLCGWIIPSDSGAPSSIALLGAGGRRLAASPELAGQLRMEEEFLAGCSPRR